MKRLKYTRRFVNVQLTGGKRKVRQHHEAQGRSSRCLYCCYLGQRLGTDTSPTDEPQPHFVNAPST